MYVFDTYPSHGVSTLWSRGHEQIVTPPCHSGDMNDQLVLLESKERRPEEPWRLDEQTREIGKRGVAQAREALRQAAQRAA